MHEKSNWNMRLILRWHNGSNFLETRANVPTKKKANTTTLLWSRRLRARRPRPPPQFGVFGLPGITPSTRDHLGGRWLRTKAEWASLENCCRSWKIRNWKKCQNVCTLCPRKTHNVQTLCAYCTLCNVKIDLSTSDDQIRYNLTLVIPFLKSIY